MVFNKTQRRYALFILLILAACLYGTHIGRHSLWEDEGHSLYDGTFLTHFPFNPLYFQVLHLWMKLGSSIAWLRALSALFALGSVYLTYRVGKKLFGDAEGLLAAGLLVLSSSFLLKAQEIRMYPMGTFLYLAGTLALLRALSKPGYLRIATWVMLRFLTLITIPMAASGLPADAFIFFLHFRKKPETRIRFEAALLALVIAWSPYATFLARHTQKFLPFGWVRNLPDPSLTRIVKVIFRENIFLSATHLNRLSELIPVFFIAISIGLWILAFERRRKREVGYTALWAFTPFLVLAGLSYLLPGSLFVNRYLLFTAPYVLIGIAAGFIQLLPRMRLAAFFCALLCVAVLVDGLADYTFGQTAIRQDWKGVVEKIHSSAGRRDRILVADKGRQFIILFKRYLDQSEQSRTLYFHSKGALSTGEADVSTSELERLVQRMDPNTPAVWVVYIPREKIRRNSIGALGQVLRPQFPYQKIFPFKGLNLLLASRIPRADLPPDPSDLKNVPVRASEAENYLA